MKNAAPSTSEPTNPELAADPRSEERATAELRSWLDAIEQARTSPAREPTYPLVSKPRAPVRRIVSSR
jgi:hypothetical protein